MLCVAQRVRGQENGRWWQDETRHCVVCKRRKLVFSHVHDMYMQGTGSEGMAVQRNIETSKVNFIFSEHEWCFH